MNPYKAYLETVQKQAFDLSMLADVPTMQAAGQAIRGAKAGLGYMAGKAKTKAMNAVYTAKDKLNPFKSKAKAPASPSAGGGILQAAKDGWNEGAKKNTYNRMKGASLLESAANAYLERRHEKDSW